MDSFEQRRARAAALAHRRGQDTPLEILRQRAERVPAARDVAVLLGGEDRSVGVIAEVKRATATFADLSGIGDVALLARFFVAGGAACVSVVTEPTLARGCLADLDAVRSAVDVPVVVNDLIVTPYQVHEARAHGADALRLDGRVEAIVLESLIERTASLGMLAIVDVRTRAQALTAVRLGARAVAVDVRDADTGQVEPERFAQVVEVLPASLIVVAAGGVASARDVMDYARAGADVVLVGEAALRSNDPQQFVAQLVAAGSHPALPPSLHREVR